MVCENTVCYCGIHTQRHSHFSRLTLKGLHILVIIGSISANRPTYFLNLIGNLGDMTVGKMYRILA